ncbi:MAG: aldose 1-epimerase, partial [Bacteroidota bacterium]
MTQFQVQKEVKRAYTQYKLVNTETGEYVAIVPQWGGILNEWQVRTDQGFANIIQGYADQEDWQSQFTKEYRSAKLFPYPNRVEGGKYTFQGQVYQLDINFPHEGNSIHGLIFDKSLSVLEEAHSSIYASLLLTFSYEGDQPGYPFPFKIKILYSYDVQNELRITTLIKNTGSHPLPYGDGWHPYIQVPHSINACYLQFQPRALLRKGDNGLPNGKEEVFDYFQSFQLIDDFQLDDCFALPTDAENQSVILQDPHQNLEISIEMETGPGLYNFVQIYTPGDRQSIAIEPVTSPPNAFNNPQACLVLPPGEQKSLSYKIKASKLF